MTDTPQGRFTARPRADRGDAARAGERIADEVVRLRARFERSTRDGRAAFIGADSDAYDIGMLAVIHLADLVNRQLPDKVAATLPEIARDGLRATRNTAAHNYAGLDNARLWETVSTHAPALLDAIDAALREPAKTIVRDQLAGESLVDELLAERRASALLDDTETDPARRR